MTHTKQLEQLYVFAVYMLGARDEAFAAVCDATVQHPGAPERWLEALVRPFLVRPSAPRTKHFAELDDILRTNSTIPIDMSHPLVRGDARRMNVLLSELPAQHPSRPHPGAPRRLHPPARARPVHRDLRRRLRHDHQRHDGPSSGGSRPNKPMPRTTLTRSRCS